MSNYQSGSEVYLFHDIRESKEEVDSQFSISQDSFETFLLNQLKHGKIALTYNQLSKLIEKGYNIKNGFFVSFDDCNLSVYNRAYPILKKLKIPFILFITKELIGRDRFLTKDQIVDMAKDPLCTIGSHALHHKMFRYLTSKEIVNEFVESRRFLQQLTGQSVDCFAFPYGRLVEVSCMSIKLISKFEYKFAFSAIAGSLSQRWLSGMFFLPRINVSEELVKNDC